MKKANDRKFTFKLVALYTFEVVQQVVEIELEVVNKARGKELSKACTLPYSLN